MKNLAQRMVEVFPPGEFIQDELDTRGWLQSDLVDILGVDKKTVSEIVSGKRSITPEMALLLGEAFGTGPEVWLNLDNAYRLHNAQGTRERAQGVSRKSKLYAEYPVRAMLKRGWLRESGDIDSLEKEIESFYSPEGLCFAARRTEREEKEPLQRAWLYQAYHLAASHSAGKFSEIALPEVLSSLRECLPEPARIAEIPARLSEAGIRFVLVEALPASLMDGACFWLDAQSPVVAVSTRLDRIDNFWFTLAHELMHVKFGHGKGRAMLDADIMGKKEDIPEEERLANDGAAELLVPQAELGNFVSRVSPLFSKTRVNGFAARIGAHPGVVVGQLQYQGHIDYKQLRAALPKVRHTIQSTAVFDGWGTSVPIGG